MKVWPQRGLISSYCVPSLAASVASSCEISMNVGLLRGDFNKHFSTKLYL